MTPSQTPLERKTKDHIRSIHKLSCSSIVPYYCVTGSADGDMRVWVCTFHVLASLTAHFVVGSSRYEQISDEDSPSNLCSLCCLLTVSLQPSSSCRRSRQRFHLSLGSWNRPEGPARQITCSTCRSNSCP